MDRTAAFGAIHAPQSFPEQERARRRLAFDELLRLQLEVVMRRHVLERDSRGIRHVVVPGAGAPAPRRHLHRSASLPVDRRAAARRRRDQRRPGQGFAHASPAARRRRVGQDGRGAERVARGGPRWPPGGAHGPHRGVGRAALPGCAGAARQPRRSRRRAPGGITPAGGGTAHQPHPGGRAGQVAPGPSRRARSTWWWAPTRCSPTRCGSRAWGSS